jgi:glutamate 5-kinase
VIVVAKIGTSSVTDAAGAVNVGAVEKLCAEVATLRRRGIDVVVVTSGAVTAGVAALGSGDGRPGDATTLQALSALGQPRLMRVYDDAFGAEGLLCGQVLLAPLDFGDRRQYLRARRTIHRLLELGVVPVVNENDAVADDELRFSDNDRIAALVANLIGAEVVVLLTDIEGLYDNDPRTSASATLLEEIRAIDEALSVDAGGPGSLGGSGGMAAKLAAARMASWSGVRVVIAAAHRANVLVDAVDEAPGVGTIIRPVDRQLGRRKLWIAFALPAAGSVRVDEGARAALVDRDASLLPAGVVGVDGTWTAGDAIEIVGPDGSVFAKGIARLGSAEADHWVGRRSADVEARIVGAVVHRDDLVVLTGP